MRIFILSVVVVCAVNATLQSCHRELNCFACIKNGCSYYKRGESQFCSGEKLVAKNYNIKIKNWNKCLTFDLDSAKAVTVKQKRDATETDVVPSFATDSATSADQTTEVSIQNNPLEVRASTPNMTTQPPSEHFTDKETDGHGNGKLPVAIGTQKTRNPSLFLMEARAHLIELQCMNFIAMRRLAIIHYKKEREINYGHAMRRCMAMMPYP